MGIMNKEVHLIACGKPEIPGSGPKISGATVLLFLLCTLLIPLETTPAEDLKPLGMSRATDLLGRTVQGSEGQKLGNIGELIIGPDGCVNYIVLSENVFDEEKLVPIPWSVLYIDDQKNVIRVLMDNERIKTAPFFKKDKWPGLKGPEWEGILQGYYHSRK